MAIPDTPTPPPQEEVSLLAGYELNRATLQLRSNFAKATPVLNGDGTPRTNVLGMPEHTIIPDGKKWALQLSTTIPAELERMNALLTSILATAIRAGVDQLGLTATDAAIQAAAIALGQAGKSIESMIAQAMEQMELDRRSGAFTPTILGDAP